MKFVVLGLLGTALAAAATGDVDVYSPDQLHAMEQRLAQKGGGFGSEQLQRYGNHYTMLAHREVTGSAEVHEKEADVFFVVSGDASILTGGKLVNGKTERAGELRGSSIEGGTRHALPQGSVIHIPAGVPHQLLIEKGKPFTYFVVKVIE